MSSYEIRFTAQVTKIRTLRVAETQATDKDFLPRLIKDKAREFETDVREKYDIDKNTPLEVKVATYETV